ALGHRWARAAPRAALRRQGAAPRRGQQRPSAPVAGVGADRHRPGGAGRPAADRRPRPRHRRRAVPGPRGRPARPVPRSNRPGGTCRVSAPEESLDLTRVAGQAAADKLAEEVIGLDVSELVVITDAFLVCSGDSERQVAAIVDGIEEALLTQRRRKPLRREGERDARWVLLDYGDIVVHVQHAEDRAFYALERLWRDAPVIDLRIDADRTA